MPETTTLATVEGAPHVVLFEDPKTIKLTLDAGDSMPSHGHPDEVILLHLVSGSMELTLDDEVVDLDAGDIVRFSGDRSISPHAVTDCVAVLVFVPAP